MKKNDDIHFHNLFNPSTLNIFTDASVHTLEDGTVLSSPGAVCIITDVNGDTFILEEDFDKSHIVIGSTNNDGEIRAVALGVYYAIKYKDVYPYINLFSDSNICIQGLTNWIFNWINCTDDTNRLYNSSGKQVANQDMLASLVNTIIEQKLSMNFYHQKGHVKNSDESYKKCFNDFIKTNKLPRNLDIDIITCISTYNNYVDIKTKDALKEFTSIYYNSEKTITPIEFTVKTEQIGEYKKLIRRRNIWKQS